MARSLNGRDFDLGAVGADDDVLAVFKAKALEGGGADPSSIFPGELRDRIRSFLEPGVVDVATVVNTGGRHQNNLNGLVGGQRGGFGLGNDRADGGRVHAGIRTGVGGGFEEAIAKGEVPFRLVETTGDRLGFADLIQQLGEGKGLRAADLIVPTAVPLLSVIPAGGLPSNPAELLAGPGTGRALNAIRQHCDILIIDSAPAVVTDGVILARHTDAVIVVAAHGTTTKTRLSATIDTLESGRMRILGVVLNRVPIEVSGYKPYVPTGTKAAAAVLAGTPNGPASAGPTPAPVKRPAPAQPARPTV